MFFGWGLLLALTSVFAAQPLGRRLGLVPTLAVALVAVSADLLTGGLFMHDQLVLILVVIASGAFLGIVNTVLTEAVMASASVERAIASSASSFVRFTGGAIVLLAKRGVLAAERATVVAMPERPRQDSNLRPAA